MLKGGQSMLAAHHGRAPPGISACFRRADLDAALAELRALAKPILGDF